METKPYQPLRLFIQAVLADGYEPIDKCLIYLQEDGWLSELVRALEQILNDDHSDSWYDTFMEENDWEFASSDKRPGKVILSDMLQKAKFLEQKIKK